MALDYSLIKTSALAGFCNPFNGCWIELEAPMTLEEVSACLQAGTEKRHRPYKGWYAEKSRPQQALRLRHAQTIAWFVKHGFSKPIEVDVGVPSLGYFVSWLVQDGNHRLAAALYKWKTEGWGPLLPVAVFGCPSHAKELGLLAPEI